MPRRRLVSRAVSLAAALATAPRRAFASPLGGGACAASPVTRQVVFDGDSLTLGYAVDDDSYPAQVARAFCERGVRVTNVAVSGQTLEEMAADAAAEVDPLYDATLALNVVCAWGGINDHHAQVPAATVYRRLATYCQARRAAGWRVVVLTCLPASGAVGGAPWEADRQWLNTTIRASWATFADAVADVAADARIGSAGAETNALYYLNDRLHLTGAGYGVVASVVAATLASLGV